MKDATVWYVNVFVTNFASAVAFYRDKLGLSVVVEDSNFGYASFKTQGAGFAIATVDPDSDQAHLAGRHTGIGWGVTSVDEAYAELTENGVEFEQAPAAQPWGGYMAIMKDPDGNLFYLDQFRDEGGH